MGPQAFRVQPLAEPDRIWNSITATLADFDGDGHVDILLGDYFRDGDDVLNPRGAGSAHLPYSQGRAFNGGGERVFRWTGATRGAEPSVSFVEETEAFPPGYPRGWALAAAAYDLDGDLRPEVYVAHAPTAGRTRSPGCGWPSRTTRPPTLGPAAAWTTCRPRNAPQSGHRFS